jgi:hypothetical protein
MNPQDMGAILGAGANDPQAEILKRQQRQVEMMRARGMEMPRGQMAGRAYIPDIGGGLMGIAANVKANRMQPQVDKGTVDIGNRNNDARQRYAQMVMEMMRRQVPQQPAMLPPDGMEDR